MTEIPDPGSDEKAQRPIHADDALDSPAHSGEQYETPHYSVPEALALDFDRTLGDVRAAMARLSQAAEECGINVDEIRAAQTRVEQDGGSFDPLSYVKRQLMPEGADEAAYLEFCNRFIAADEPPVLYEDAARFLYMLQFTDTPHVILTYGVNPEWQRLKLAAAGYPVGRNVMGQTDKGAAISSLRAADGKYHFYVGLNGDALYTADSMSLIDDKAAAFASLPDNSRGFLIQRGEALPSQLGELLDRVVRIGSLDELTIDASGRLIQTTGSDADPPANWRRRWTIYDPDVELRNPGYAVYQPLGAGAVIRRRPWDEPPWVRKADSPGSE